MNTLIRALAGGCLAVLLSGGGVRAGEPAKPLESGHVLLLDGDRILEGDVTREGDRYRIKRALGETWVPVAKAVRLCADREDAYRFLRGRANLRDVDERLRLARWCRLHGLTAQSLVEAKAALELRPANPEARRLVQVLGHPPAVNATPAPKKEPDGPAGPGAEVTLEALGMFAGKVQPILMNTCASCHIANKGGSAFKLVRAFGDGATNQRSTQQNLAAVVPFINRDNWQASPLLVKAVSIHGETNKAPLKSRQAQAYRTLEEWVQITVATLPPREGTTTAANVPMTPPARAFAEVAAPKTQVVPAAAKPAETPKADVKELEKVSGDGLALKPVPPPAKTAEATPKAVEKTDKPAAPADPFDPAIFNQQRRQ